MWLPDKSGAKSQLPWLKAKTNRVDALSTSIDVYICAQLSMQEFPWHGLCCVHHLHQADLKVIWPVHVEPSKPLT